MISQQQNVPGWSMRMKMMTVTCKVCVVMWIIHSHLLRALEGHLAMVVEVLSR